LSRNFQLQFLRPVIGRRDVRIVLQSGALGELLAQLQAHRIDVLLANTVPPRDAATPWVPHRIAEQPVGVVAHKARSEAANGSLAQLLETHPLVLPSADTAIRHGFDALVERLGIRPTVAAEVDDMAMLRLLVREDEGIAVVPPIVVRDELADGALVELARLPDLSETFHAIVAKRRFPNPLVRELLSPADQGGGEGRVSA
jgi:LysR family transcriptional activator of nhaA